MLLTFFEIDIHIVFSLIIIVSILLASILSSVITKPRDSNN
jgi:hypothetical protein